MRSMQQDCPYCKFIPSTVDSILISQGRVCAHGDCDSHLHKSCYATLMTAPKPKCPLCNKEFADAEPTFLGEESVSRAEDGYTKTKEKRKRPAGAKRNGAAGGSDEEDELDDEDGPGSDGEEEESTTRSKKGKGKVSNSVLKD